MTPSDEKRLALQGSMWRLQQDVPSPVAGSRARLWLSCTMNSRLYNCAWHRLEFEELELGPGDVLTIFTRTSNDQDHLDDPDLADEIGDLVTAGWTDAENAGFGLWQPTSTVRAADTTWRVDDRLIGREQRGRRFQEVLVQSDRGQFLVIALHLVRVVQTDQAAAPDVNASMDCDQRPWRLVRVLYPRRSLLDHLPAVYCEDPLAGNFLERWLSVFQHEWDAIERQIVAFHTYLDPKLAPAPAALRYLADWFDLKLDGAWLDKDRDHRRVRDFLRVALAVRSRRGTPVAVEALLRAWFNAADVPTQGGRLPRLIEGFRIRRFFAFGRSDRARLARSAPLSIDPGADAARLDSGARLGRTRLPLAGKTALGGEALAQFGHRNVVFVPPCPGADDAIKRAIASIFPASQTVESKVVEPGICLANDSILGVNTLLTGRPRAPRAEV